MVFSCECVYKLRSFDLGFFFQAEDGIRDLVRSRGLGDVYKRQSPMSAELPKATDAASTDALEQHLIERIRKGAIELLSLIHI